MANKKFTIQRLRSDGAYVFAALFSVFGSYTLLSSYADSKPLKTYQPGVYQLSEFAVKSSQTYKLGIKKGLHYCFSPAVLINPSSSVLVNAKTSTRLTITQQNGTSACFISDTSYDKIEVNLPGFVAQPTILTVQ